MTRRRARTDAKGQASERSYRRRLTNPFEPLRVLSDDEVAYIHTSAVRYLADEGIRVLFDEARDIYSGAGASVDDDLIVRLDPDTVLAAIDTAPSLLELHAPNPERNVVVGGNHVALVPVGGPPFISDLVGGRRAGTLADQQDFLRLTQTYDVLAATAPSVEPGDVPLAVRHLESGLSTLMLTDKLPFVYARGRQRVRDNIDLIKIRHGIVDDAEFASVSRCWANINTNTPRQLDVPMSMAIIDFARMGQVCIMTPFTLAGAMAPVTLAGALVLQHIEVLAAITLAQLVRPGAPVMYGAFTSNVDMRSGSPAFGTPEAMKGALASGQLARHVGVPWRSSGSSTSNTVDAQAGYETMANTYAALLGGASWILHAAGWQEGGLTASLEKFVVDVEMCQIIADLLQPIVVDDVELALDAITEVGPGGHFFGATHTLERYKTAFYEPLVFERTNYEQWAEHGMRRTDERAAATWQSALDSYVPPPIDDTVAEAMRAFVDRRTAEGGAPPD
ncbi:MAG: trimethylamine methyltransferase family protein [Actinomycetia bacterium]|nr:trimethylamine methyltransferase family protein [Actinomycetes bacterium]